MRKDKVAIYISGIWMETYRDGYSSYIDEHGGIYQVCIKIEDTIIRGFQYCIRELAVEAESWLYRFHNDKGNNIVCLPEATEFIGDLFCKIKSNYDEYSVDLYFKGEIIKHIETYKRISCAEYTKHILDEAIKDGKILNYKW